MQLNWLHCCGICQLMPLKLWPNTAQGCNHQSNSMTQLQLLCSAALVSMYNPGDMKTRVNPVQRSKPYSILAPTQASKPLVAAMRSLLLPNCKGSHSVRVLFVNVRLYWRNIYIRYLLAQSVFNYWELEYTMFDKLHRLLPSAYFQAGHPDLLGLQLKKTQPILC